MKKLLLLFYMFILNFSYSQISFEIEGDTIVRGFSNVFEYTLAENCQNHMIEVKGGQYRVLDENRGMFTSDSISKMGKIIVNCLENNQVTIIESKLFYIEELASPSIFLDDIKLSSRMLRGKKVRFKNFNLVARNTTQKGLSNVAYAFRKLSITYKNKEINLNFSEFKKVKYYFKKLKRKEIINLNYITLKGPDNIEIKIDLDVKIKRIGLFVIANKFMIE